MPVFHGGLVDLVEAATARLLAATAAQERNRARLRRLNPRSMFEAAIIDDHVAAVGETQEALELLQHIRRAMTEANGGRRLHLVAADVAPTERKDHHESG